MSFKFAVIGFAIFLEFQYLLAGELKFSNNPSLAMDLQNDAAIISPEFIELLRQFPYNSLSAKVKSAELIDNSTLRVIAEVKWVEDFLDRLTREASISQKIISNAENRKVTLPVALFCLVDKSLSRPQCMETTDGYYSSIRVTVQTPLICRISLLNTNGEIVKQEEIEYPRNLVPISTFGDTRYGRKKSINIQVDRLGGIDHQLHVDPNLLRQVATVRVDVLEARRRFSKALFQR